ncbi:ribonuclease III [Sulfobacillus acidophilus TPY]|uniref:Ribonuclease 3 n=1 Tax=Sulfobacillus acidophilus (strain ATCC 700253 / DSM 10332 / NAL) TaxID=679936 RepID=G8TVH6_SULAD|nr:ribonuclease III [Sulfobacillus acidophilus TPY]AEW05895.1 RNAse III [Sulfobacillus acidophilus DSM 10332]
MAFDRPLEEFIHDAALLRQALTHSSYANEGYRKEIHNERLEFLGDAVLQLVVTEWLYRQNPAWSEGQLSQARAAIVCEETLAEAAVSWNLGPRLLLGRGEERSGGRYKPSLLADAMEAVIGAVYLSEGFDVARQFVLETMAFALNSLEGREAGRDHKTALNEWLRRHGWEAQYQVVGSYGPDHAKTFEVEVAVNGEPKLRAIGRSKKEAEQQAARQLLRQLVEQESQTQS